ncbi:MAG TPA: FtsX-like permease family protein [Solirubrobacteraceae bacterium]|nr:FtsX-like permease family protein [Solirubrobacteraceae bacterium]
MRSRRRRALLTAIGIALAAAMLSTAIVIADGLGDGFSRAVRAADLPDVIVRFQPQSLDRVASRIRALADIAAFSTRQEFTNVGIGANGHRSRQASVEVVDPGRRGYAIVAGRDLSSRYGEVVVERGVAQAWGIRLGGTLYIRGVGPQRVVGFAEAPDDVGYPLGVPRIYVSERAIEARFGPEPDPQVTVAEIWLRNPRYINEVLAQARTTSYGLRGLRFVTRSGVRVLLDQAAGIVIDLLVALSVFALATAGVMLAASARAEVQRRLKSIGINRALGASRGHLVRVQAVEAMAVAGPAATVGLAVGVLVAVGPSDRLLTMLNEPGAGSGLILPLAAGWVVSVSIPVLAAAWPAWRASGRPPVALLQGAGISHGRAASRRRAGVVRRAALGGLAALGAHLVAARRGRLAATVLTLATSAAFVLLLLALAAALNVLETDPQALGKRYQLTASGSAASVGKALSVPGVEAAAPRYDVQGVDSFSLGETIDVIAYPGDHTIFEAPPLTAGHRLHGDGEAEVGAGLAIALGLTPGSTLAIALPNGAELRLRVAGVVNSLDHDGRVAYVPAAALLRDDPTAPETLAILLRQNASETTVSHRLTAIGVPPTPTSGATARGVPLVDTLRTILRAIAIVDGLVCLYALIQTCALTVQERRRTIAVLRATGAGSAAVARLLAGVVLALVLPAAILGVLIERLVLGPALSRLAINYATLELGADSTEIVAVVAGLLAAGVIAVLWVTRQATRETVVTGLTSA